MVDKKVVFESLIKLTPNISEMDTTHILHLD